MVVFNTGETRKTVGVGTRANGVAGAGGTVTLEISEHSFYALDEPYTATVTVSDNEPLALSVADAEGHEGAGATVAFAVMLSRAASAPVTVDYATADGTAMAGADYTESSGRLTFTPGETAKTVSVPIIDDTVDDSGETFTLVLSNASGAVLADAEATGTILNTESPAALTARAPDAPGGLTVATAAGREGELDVSWTAPASDGGFEVTGYKVQWKSGSEAWNGTVASTRQAPVSDPAVLSHRIAGLTVGTAYTVRVMAVNAAGDGAAVEETATVQDRVVPAFAGATVNGTALTVIFSEALVAASKPPADAFAVTVAGAARTAAEVALSGSAVELTLGSAVAAGETVTVGYTVPTSANAAPLKDAAGNAVASFSGEAVTNETLASANRATPPSQPRIIGIYADEGKLRLRWVQYGGDGGLPVIGYKVQWKSGEQEYGPSRQAVVSVAKYTIEGLTDGVEYIVRVIATNAIGDSLPSWEHYAMPGSPEESMLNHIENEIVEKYGDSFPWLRASWSRMNQPGFNFRIIESGGWFGAAVQASCSSRDASYNYFD